MIEVEYDERKCNKIQENAIRYNYNTTQYCKNILMCVHATNKSLIEFNNCINSKNSFTAALNSPCITKWSLKTQSHLMMFCYNVLWNI